MKGWRKKYFYMPIERAEIIEAQLKLLKQLIHSSHPKIHKEIDESRKFLEKKMK
jgi:hypothetical protein